MRHSTTGNPLIIWFMEPDSRHGNTHLFMQSDHMLIYGFMHFQLSYIQLWFRLINCWFSIIQDAFWDFAVLFVKHTYTGDYNLIIMKINPFSISKSIILCCCWKVTNYYIIFFRGVTRQFGSSIARLYLFFTILSTGMFISSTAFLPSSFSMYMTILTFGAWLQQHYKIVILTSATSALIGWPFSALLRY